MTNKEASQIVFMNWRNTAGHVTRDEYIDYLIRKNPELNKVEIKKWYTKLYGGK